MFFTATLITEALLKSLHSRLGFKVIKYFATHPKFVLALKQFHYDSGKYKALQKQNIGLQCYLTIPQRLHLFKTIELNSMEIEMCSNFLNEFPPSDDWFPYE